MSINIEKKLLLIFINKRFYTNKNVCKYKYIIKYFNFNIIFEK